MNLPPAETIEKQWPWDNRTELSDIIIHTVFLVLSQKLYALEAKTIYPTSFFFFFFFFMKSYQARLSPGDDRGGFLYAQHK